MGAAEFHKDVADKDRVVRRLAADHDWSNPVNRAISYMAESLLRNGVPSHIVYDAIAAVPVRDDARTA